MVPLADGADDLEVVVLDLLGDRRVAFLAEGSLELLARLVVVLVVLELVLPQQRLVQLAHFGQLLLGDASGQVLLQQLLHGLLGAVLLLPGGVLSFGGQAVLARVHVPDAEVVVHSLRGRLLALQRRAQVGHGDGVASLEVDVVQLLDCRHAFRRRLLGVVVRQVLFHLRSQQLA